MATVHPKKLDLDPKYDDYDYPTEAPVEQNGHPGFTTPEQDAQVHQLRMLLEGAGCKERLDTLTLLRFLRARKFNVELSKQMFLDCEQWRKDFNLDWLVPNFEYTEKAQVFEYYPQYYHKTDKDGRPVYIEHLGKINLTKMYEITTSERMLQNLACEYEKLADPRLPACSRKAGHLLETCCTIMDLKGVGITSAPSVYGYLKSASGMSQNAYPERLGKLYIVNAPWGFATVFSVVKSFLDPVTVKKIHVLGSGYQKELLEQVPQENLPVILGGVCECDGGCMLSDAGPWHEAEWAKPPKWATPKNDVAPPSDVIENRPQDGTVDKPTDTVITPAPAPGITKPDGATAGEEPAPASAPIAQ